MSTDTHDLHNLRESAISRIQNGENPATVIDDLIARVMEAKEVILRIRTITDKAADLADPTKLAAITKLRAFTGTIEYQTEKGRAALSVEVWMKRHLLDTGRLSLEELRIMPMWAFREFNPRLYQALLDSKRTKSR